MSRVTGSVLLVGSVPGNDARTVMDSCAKGLGNTLFALPDGETGYRQGWINFLAAKTYAASEQLETIARPQPVDPNAPDEWRAPGMDWMPRGFQDHWQFKVKDGAGPLHFEQLGYAQEAKNAYHTFCTLRDQGIIPQGVRFQVSLPLIESGIRLFIGHSPRSFQPMWDAYRDAMGRELRRLSQEISPRDLAIQWDIAAEVASIESNDHDPMLGLPWDAPGDPFERYVQAVVDLSQHISDETLLGLHLCYGDLGPNISRSLKIWGWLCGWRMRGWLRSAVRLISFICLCPEIATMMSTLPRWLTLPLPIPSSSWALFTTRMVFGGPCNDWRQLGNM